VAVTGQGPTVSDERDDDDGFVMSLTRLSQDGIRVTVGRQQMELTQRQARMLLNELEQWLYPLGRDTGPLTEWEWSPEARARGTESADAVFEGAGLDRDEPGMEEAYKSVQTWFAKNHEAIEASERGEDDGCPCEKCREQFGPLPDGRSS